MKLPTAVIALVLALQPAFADMTDEQACAEGKPQYSKEGMTEKDCLCMLRVASSHMTPKLKTAFVESLLAQDENPMGRMMATGVTMEELMKAMTGYANEVGSACGIEQ